MKKFLISFIALLMGVVIGVGIWHGIAYKDNLTSFVKDTWSKIESVFVNKDNVSSEEQKPSEDQPTPDKPSEEQINLDGLYYINIDGDYSFVQIKDSKYGIIDGYIQDSKIYLASDWESSVELNSFHTTEDDKYLHVFVTDQVNSNEYKIAIYDKTSKTLYYDFSNGQQIPGEIYEEQSLFEMVKFDEYEISDSSSEVCEHDWVEDLSYVPTAPSCGQYWDSQYICSKCNETKLETNGPLPHDYVNGVCSRCGESDPNYVEVCEHNFEKITCSTTCVSDGTEVEECSICGFTRYNSIPAYGHNYVNGVCSRCGETDPNHVVAPVSLDGMYYFITNDGVVLVNQIEGDKYVQFTAYFRNGDQSVIYLPQDYEGYIENGYTLSITETDTNIVASIVEIPSLGEYFNYDKTTQTLYFGGTPITKITNFEILPYEEPRIYVENDVLHMTDMTGIDGTYSVYYQFMSGSIDGEILDSYFEEQECVVGNVAEFDLSLLINRESVPMLEGCTYEIRVVFATTDGFLIRGYESIEYTVPNVEICEHDWVEDLSYVPTAPSCGQYWDSQYICSKCNETKLETNGPLPHDYVNGVCLRCGESDPNYVSEITLSINSSTNEDFWLLFDVSSVKEYLLSEDSGNTSGFVFEVFLENSTTHEGNKLLTQTLSLSDFNIMFGVDEMFASYYSQGNYNLSIVISSSTNFKIDNIIPVSFNHDGSHYLLTLSA